jgi:hypothetical protein
MENLAVKEEHESPKDPWYFKSSRVYKISYNIKKIFFIILYYIIILFFNSQGIKVI